MTRYIENLDSTFTDKELPIAGDYIVAEKVDGNFYIKADSTQADPINLKVLRAFQIRFGRLYVTNPTAVSGGQVIFYVFSKEQVEITILTTAANVVISTDEVGLAKDATVKGVTDDSVKGLLRSLGDAGASPTGFTGKTLLRLMDEAQKKATTPAQYAVTLTTANTEYSQALPSGCKKFTAQCRTAFDVRFAFTAGKVATPTDPYGTIKSGSCYYEDNVDLTGVTMYLASGQAGVVVEITAWT